MLKKLLFTVALFSGLTVITHAQSFTFDVGNPLVANTSGNNALVMDHYIKNITATDTFSITWSVLSESYPDMGWELTSLCDNMICYYTTQLGVGTNHTSDNIAPGARGIFKADFKVPAASANGVGILKVLVGIENGQSDTMVYQINKTPTGLSVININDSRVSLSPNPASNTLSVYSDKGLKAEKIRIMNLLGQTILTKEVAQSSDITNVDVNTLAKGTYLITLSNDKGQVVTSRKFVKE